MEVNSVLGITIEKKADKKTIIIFGLAITLAVVIALILAPIGFWMFYNGLCFWTEVEFKNESSEEIWITPIGYEENIRQIGPLAHIYRPTPYHHPQNTQFHLMPNESISIKYDWDDQNLQFIMVESSSEIIQLLPLDESKWENWTICQQCCCSPDNSSYSIPTLNQLETAPEWLHSTIQGEFVTIPSEYN